MTAITNALASARDLICETFPPSSQEPSPTEQADAALDQAALQVCLQDPDRDSCAAPAAAVAAHQSPYANVYAAFCYGEQKPGK